MQRAANVWDRFYRYHAAPWRGEREADWFRKRLGAGPVLELGCGNGKTLRPLLRDGVAAVGIDIAWHALRRQHRSAAGRLALADAAWLPFGAGAFSAVLDLHCTGHLGADGRRRAWREAARVLQAGGRLFVERLGPGDLRAGQARPVQGEPACRVLEDGRMTCFLDEAQLRREAAATGWRVESLTAQERQVRLRDRTATRQWLRACLGRAGATGPDRL